MERSRNEAGNPVRRIFVPKRYPCLRLEKQYGRMLGEPSHKGRDIPKEYSHGRFGALSIILGEVHILLGIFSCLDLEILQGV